MRLVPITSLRIRKKFILLCDAYVPRLVRGTQEVGAANKSRHVVDIGIILLLVCSIYHSPALAAESSNQNTIHNPRVEKLVANIIAPSYLNTDYFNVIFDYVYQQVKPTQEAIVNCLSKQQHSPSCENHQLQLPKDIKFIESIEVNDYRLVVRFQANQDLGVTAGKTLIMIPGGTAKQIHWKMTGSIFNLLPDKPAKATYFCPKPKELDLFQPGRPRMIDGQNLLWEVTNPERLQRLRGQPLQLLLVSISADGQGIFCAYTDYVMLTPSLEALQAIPGTGEWGKPQSGICRPPNGTVGECPFILE